MASECNKLTIESSVATRTVKTPNCNENGNRSGRSLQLNETVMNINHLFTGDKMEIGSNTSGRTVGSRANNPVQECLRRFNDKVNRSGEELGEIWHKIATRFDRLDILKNRLEDSLKQKASRDLLDDCMTACKEAEKLVTDLYLINASLSDATDETNELWSSEEKLKVPLERISTVCNSDDDVYQSDEESPVRDSVDGTVAYRTNYNINGEMRRMMPKKAKVTLNSVVEVAVGYVESPHSLWIQTTPNELYELQDRLQSEQEALVKQGWSSLAFDEIKAGNICAGLYLDDMQWYRAIVVSICDGKCDDAFLSTHEEHSVQLEYIDYGNRATVKTADIMPLPAFAMAYNIQSIHCSINSFEDDTYTWDKKRMDEFRVACFQPFVEAIFYRSHLSAKTGKKIFTVDVFVGENKEKAKSITTFVNL